MAGCAAVGACGTSTTTGVAMPDEAGNGAANDAPTIPDVLDWGNGCVEAGAISGFTFAASNVPLASLPSGAAHWRRHVRPVRAIAVGTLWRATRSRFDAAPCPAGLGTRNALALAMRTGILRFVSVLSVFVLVGATACGSGEFLTSTDAPDADSGLAGDAAIHSMPDVLAQADGSQPDASGNDSGNGQDSSANDTGLSGPAACVAAGGQCVLGPAMNCATVGPEDCNPTRNPGGAVCCLAPIVDDAGSCSSPRLILASNYDQSCNADSDCVEVATGDACKACALHCPNAAINASARAQYASDSAKDTPMFGIACPGACLSEQGPCCRGGTCHVGASCGAPPPVDAGRDSAADPCGGKCSTGETCVQLQGAATRVCAGAHCGSGEGGAVCPSGQSCELVTFDPCPPPPPGAVQCEIASITYAACVESSDGGAGPDGGCPLGEHLCFVGCSAQTECSVGPCVAYPCAAPLGQ